MKESPILFSAPMVKAILEGAKTTTRRVLNPQPFGPGKFNAGIEKFFYREDFKKWWGVPEHIEEWDPSPSTLFEINCPFGIPGDLLWVRETFGVAWNSGAFIDPCVNYKATLERIPIIKDATMKRWQNLYLEPGRKPWDPDKWKPSIFMPKWACRIWLKIKSVRVEYLNAITREDIIKEGACTEFDQSFMDPWITLWDSINGKPKPGKPDISWNANPWVWVVEFERTEKPQDNCAPCPILNKPCDARQVDCPNAITITE